MNRRGNSHICKVRSNTSNSRYTELSTENPCYIELGDVRKAFGEVLDNERD